MDEVYYVKKGKRYTPVSYYSSNLMDSYPVGATLVVVKDHCTSRRYGVTADLAPMIAAGMLVEDKISKAVTAASAARPMRELVSQKERDLWNALTKEMGQSNFYVQYPSAHDITQAAVQALQSESEKLLANPTVRAAYEQFLLVCKLTTEYDHEQ